MFPVITTALLIESCYSSFYRFHSLIKMNFNSFFKSVNETSFILLGISFQILIPANDRDFCPNLVLVLGRKKLFLWLNLVLCE